MKIKKEKDLIKVRLTEEDIEALANGEELIRGSNDSVTISIQQSIFRDITMPIVNRDKKIFSKAEIKSRKSFQSMIGITSTNNIKR